MVWKKIRNVNVEQLTKAIEIASNTATYSLSCKWTIIFREVEPSLVHKARRWWRVWPSTNLRWPTTSTIHTWLVRIFSEFKADGNSYKPHQEDPLLDHSWLQNLHRNGTWSAGPKWLQCFLQVFFRTEMCVKQITSFWSATRYITLLLDPKKFVRV